MVEPWSDDFTYASHGRLLLAAAERGPVVPVCDAEDPAILTDPGVLVLRHDVDVSLEHAVALAEHEAALGFAATYMIMTSAALYSIADASSVEALVRLRELGHDVGLHYDSVGDGGSADLAIDVLEASIASACERLGHAAGAPVRSLSFHRPQPQFLRGPHLVAGRVNAYAAPLMEGYISDSAGRFREGDPLQRVEDRSLPLRQLLTHPIWWGATHQTGPDRLESFFRTRTAGCSPDEARTFDERLASSLPGVRRAGPPSTAQAQTTESTS